MRRCPPGASSASSSISLPFSLKLFRLVAFHPLFEEEDMFGLLAISANGTWCDRQ